MSEVVTPHMLLLTSLTSSSRTTKLVATIGSMATFIMSAI